jgi:hypothetical protein
MWYLLNYRTGMIGPLQYAAVEAVDASDAKKRLVQLAPWARQVECESEYTRLPGPSKHTTLIIGQGFIIV